VVCMRLVLTSLSLVQGFLKHNFILRTLALAHLTGIGGSGEDDSTDRFGKPIGALILSMQAVRDNNTILHYDSSFKYRFVECLRFGNPA
jgi:hypothetical protein